jgi:splicing factor 3B subunit 5
MAQEASYKRFNIHAQLEHLQSKYTGCGHADTTKWEWQTTVHRDTQASHVGRFSRLAFVSIVENQPIARTRMNCLQVRVIYCDN